MRCMWFDFETYWADDYTLKDLTPIEYILDPRFEALGCAFITNGDEGGEGERIWVDGPELPAYFRTIDWANTFAVSHNALFDALILSQRYNIVPGFYGCTLSMARNWISHSTGKVSLKACAEYYGLPPKMETVMKTKGVGYAAMRAMPALHNEVRTYALDDATKCRKIFKMMLLEGFPQRELEMVDMVIRMAALPQFELDLVQLTEHLAEVKARKQELLERAQLTDSTNLMKDVVFETMLLMEGVVPPQKWSVKQGKMINAFAKDDKEFKELLEHPNPLVQALVAARLGHKSTLEETRTERLISISQKTTKAPVPLKYSGAHTHRFSGDWSINLQNLPNKSKLRHALKAPKGHLVVSVDASQIEARINAELSGELHLVEAFRNNVDVYSEFAERIYGYHVTKKTHPHERDVGKVGILSCGYGASSPRFLHMCQTKDVDIDQITADRVVSVYRSMYAHIVKNWKHAEYNVLRFIGSGEGSTSWGPCEIEYQKITLPSGNSLRYRDLKYVKHDDRYGWTYMRGNMPHYIYGAKLVENVVQALAFIHIMETAWRIKHLTDGLFLPAHQVHDELIYIVPEHLAEVAADIVKIEMSKSPKWMPSAPLAAEAHIGVTYGDTK